MNIATAPKTLRFSIGLFASLCALTATAFAVNFSTSPGRVLPTHGTGTSTVTEVIYNPDDTLSLKAEQKGTLSRLGTFTGTFAYIATIDYDTGITLITGDGTFKVACGDKLFLSANIVEVGLDYPRPFTGALTITGGTGRFAGASGLLEISGIDEENPTDGIVLNGSICTNRFKKTALALE